MTSYSPSAKMASYLSRLSPVPAFPDYTGPFKVGTMDVEIPVSDLPSPSPAPENAADIPTVLFRIFYPAVDESDEKCIPWLPNPQRHHISAYTRFVGVGNTLAEFLSFFPRHLNYTTIPAHKNSKLRSSDGESARWPTMIFSHGLGGSRNSYSYIAGSLASHGLVVICPEHRDGSAVASFIRIPDENNKASKIKTKKMIQYNRISHDVSPEVYEMREAQLRIRLWELGLVHEAILAMDKGTEFRNINTSTTSLQQFVGRLKVHEPGSIIFAGHSFGATTMTQWLKSTYYADNEDVSGMEKPLFTPKKDSAIRKQVTERNVTMLLDMWCMPLLAPNSEVLFNLPLPLYDDLASAVGGTGLLAVESESFYKWTEHLHIKARILSPEPKARTVLPTVYERPSGIKQAEPNFFYVVNSAHLSQSDFGILFPWLTKKIFDAEQPERALRLNLRAQLQLLRVNNIPIARTYAGDLVDGSTIDKLDSAKKDESSVQVADGLMNDQAIFDRSGTHVVDFWRWIDIIGLGDAGEKEKGKTVGEQVEEGEKDMEGEMEPSEQRPTAVSRTFSSKTFERTLSATRTTTQAAGN
ncbi:platelet-activating factor acetylhydrolase, isoform II-domain-containing protein [Emericellopsis atlantica]|uniref:Putative phospholipase n=1 Tax=Emericellopsis atlantica TaxID=2614577 RepID=A0A9P8CP04_9HYPO|nr:platelet-activating factor acetylhydrolase, isoform II-domain-containing protein [Emericellopsis atlantica]KAG9252271.1 platelet-activating factor acetylhydrolase, isoform II-domain-containing protein [Emericellopsis atlantica]